MNHSPKLNSDGSYSLMSADLRERRSEMSKRKQHKPDFKARVGTVPNVGVGRSCGFSRSVRCEGSMDRPRRER